MEATRLRKGLGVNPKHKTKTFYPSHCLTSFYRFCSFGQEEWPISLLGSVTSSLKFMGWRFMNFEALVSTLIVSLH